MLATDPTTGKTKKRRVTALITGAGQKQMVELTIDGDDAKGGPLLPVVRHEHVGVVAGEHVMGKKARGAGPG